ncbi:collagen alpha-1(XII) chain-like isoform X2 [Camelus ferus]|uniref:Collagen alpha-1(XII) chain-like isoform X2 n=1 Tax=Camelus ferus TaxID=419612 RepID=A0A8B8R9J9_CAMFR|nr:collagen alpha-1(XII) chain-like isoform X2 [Camelus ferus]
MDHFVHYEFYMNRLESSAVLKDLNPDTECVVDMSSVVEAEGHRKTWPLPSPRGLKLCDMTHSTRNVLWEPAPGKVHKYIVRYKTPEEVVREVG